jgi:pyridoxamine 5'-phosphate oxidase
MAGTSSPEPLTQFRRWFAAARRARAIRLPEAACLSTVDRTGRPDGRVVLVKRADRRGFVFYTNLRSPKALSLHRAPHAALTFHWPPLGRQVRIRGRVVPLAAAEADAYFASRPRVTQLGAWASSAQSAPLKSRAVLERRLAFWRRRFAGRPVPRPSYWSGLRLIPSAVEFWQERPHRLHDRFLYARTPAGRWRVQRLYP